MSEQTPPPEGPKGDTAWRHPRPMVPIAVGVVGLTVIGAIQFWPVRTSMERDLSRRSAEALKSAGISDVSVTFVGQDGTIRGTVKNAAEAHRAEQVLRHLNGVRKAKAKVAVRTPDTSTTAATPTGPQTPTPSSAPTTKAQTQPPTTSPSPGRSTDASPTDTKGTPPSIGAVLTPGAISVTGAVPSEEARRKLLSGIAAAVPGVTIDDHLLIDDSVSEQGLADFPAVLGAIGERPGQGAEAVARVTWQGGTVVLSGTVLSRAAVDAAAKAATTLAGDPTKVTNTLEVAATETPANPAKSLQATIDRSPAITFATASCTLTPADRSTVRRIAAAIKTADHHATGDSPSSVVLSIDGFADSRGPADYNLDLGRCRARSVYRTLVGLGVDAEQLTVRSFGEAHPIASNRTVAGRAANRRVEIHITG